MSSATVRSINALEELQTGLVRYAAEAQATLDAVQREVGRLLAWLEERVRHWQREVQRLQEEERRAFAALRACLSSGDAKHPPNCGAYQQAYVEANRRRIQAEAELQVATHARKALQTEAESYQREALRLRTMLQDDTAKAVETLRTKTSILRSYAAGGSSLAGVGSDALAFGAGLVIGAALGAAAGATRGQEADAPAASAAVEGHELPIQVLHPEMRSVALHQIDQSDSPVTGDADFHKVPRAQMVEGLEKLGQVQRWIEQGATEQMLRDIDQERGLEPGQGYHNIYKVFYGDSAIALEWVEGRYRVLNGYHRLAVATQLGWTAIPARIVG